MFLDLEYTWFVVVEIIGSESIGFKKIMRTHSQALSVFRVQTTFCYGPGLSPPQEKASFKSIVESLITIKCLTKFIYI